MKSLGEPDAAACAIQASRCPDLVGSVTYRRGSLRAFVSELTGIDASSIICFLSDGQQLRDENVRQLAGTPEDVCAVHATDRS